jgi:hypothetical protein
VTVYALIHTVDYEGSTLHGVFSTLEKAIIAKAELVRSGAWDWLWIQRVEIDRVRTKEESWSKTDEVKPEESE